MKNSNSLRYSFFLLVGDFLALVGAFGLAYLLRVNWDQRSLVQFIPAKQYLGLFLVILPFWLIIFALLNLYKSEVYENRFSELARLFIGCVVGFLFIFGVAYVLDREVFPARLVAIYGLTISFLFVLLFRTVARGTRRLLYGFGYGINNVLFVGNSTVTHELVNSMHNYKKTGYRVVGVVGKKSGKLDESRQFANFSQAISALEHLGIQSIIQTELYSDSEKNDEILNYALQNHLAYRFVPGNLELFVGNITVDLFQNVPVIAVHQTALVGWGRIAKRLFDLVISLLLIVFFSWLYVLIGLFILIFDFGPVFFSQKRLSRFDNQVKIYKFRTFKTRWNGMSPEDAFTAMGKPELVKQYRENGDQLDKDPRISAIGGFLRKFSLDELPQLFNVLKGDISLVGPRALVPEELNKYIHKNRILSVKSGLTGLAQISGRGDISFEERRKLDLYYVQNWSFWSDLVIIAKTAGIVITGKGARQ